MEYDPKTFEEALKSLDRRMDNQAKYILSHRSLAAFIVKAILPAFENIPVKKIATDYLEELNKESDLIKKGPNEMNVPGESNRRFDVFFEVFLPKSDRKLWFDLEFQNSYESNVLLRAAVYAAQGITGQQTLNPESVVSAWINMDEANKRSNRIYSFLMKEYVQTDGLEGKIVITPVKNPDYQKDDGSIRLYFINVGNPNQEGFTEIFKLLYAVFNGEIKIVKKIYESHGLVLSNELEMEVNVFMTLDQARVLKGISIGLEKGITQNEEKNRKEIINALNIQKKNIQEINDFLKLTNKQPLTDEEIKKFDLKL